MCDDVGSATRRPDWPVRDDVGSATRRPDGAVRDDVGSATRRPDWAVCDDVGSATRRPDWPVVNYAEDARSEEAGQDQAFPDYRITIRKPFHDRTVLIQMRPASGTSRGSELR